LTKTLYFDTIFLLKDGENMIEINYDQVIEELKKKNLYDIQKELTVQRRTRTAVMSFLLSALLLTFVFGTLENPFTYTLSNIGNFFNYRHVFIIWAIVSGVAIETAMIALFKLEKYKDRNTYIYVYLATFFLIATAIIPALKETYPVLHYIHLITSVLLSIFYTLAVIPFSIWISKENPRLRRIITIWLMVIWAGSISMVIIYRHSAMFELWFFATMILFLIYLSLVLFEEKIIKMSIRLMMDEDNLNLAIEKVFVNLENISNKRKKELEKQTD
jgi:hypothetical protein